MCMGGSKPKAADPPAPAPPPPADPPTAPVVNETAASERNVLTSAKRGRGSLRIDLAASGPSGGSGLSVPT
jgi:hypothetical protein